MPVTDFGFFFDISPGKNIGFERAPFKLTEDMMQIMGGSATSEPFVCFMELAVRAFLVAREHLSEIVTLVEAMLETHLPCFMPRTIANLTGRFSPGKSVTLAAKDMSAVMLEALQLVSWLTTKTYDKYQDRMKVST
jgi:phosphatidylinositol 4-kinase A